jgi:hypothetical protein
MDGIPAYVEEVLASWDELALFAYAWYEKKGRIVVAIEQDTESPQDTNLLAVTYDYEHGKPDPVTAGLIAAYDPVYEIVIQFRDDAGQIRTQRLKTAPGARHPKRVFFFEMLRRINEEFDTIDPHELPDWFIKALGELDDAARKHE